MRHTEAEKRGAMSSLRGKIEGDGVGKGGLVGKATSTSPPESTVYVDAQSNWVKAGQEIGASAGEEVGGVAGEKGARSGSVGSIKRFSDVHSSADDPLEGTHTIPAPKLPSTATKESFLSSPKEPFSPKLKDFHANAFMKQSWQTDTSLISNADSVSTTRSSKKKPAHLTVEIPIDSTDGSHSPVFKRYDSDDEPDPTLSPVSPSKPFTNWLSESHLQNPGNWSPTHDEKLGLFGEGGRYYNGAAQKRSEEAVTKPKQKSAGATRPATTKTYRKLSETIGESSAPPPALISRVPDMVACIAEALESQPIARPKPDPRPRLSAYAMRYTSQRDRRDGPHLTTTDGDLIDAETGEYLFLDNPSDQNMGDHDPSTVLPRGPTIPLPEAKNGATAFDAPRDPKPLGRVLYNFVTGSNRPPSDDDGLDSSGASNDEGARIRLGDGPITDEGLRVVLRLSEAWKMDVRSRRRVLLAMKDRWERELEWDFGAAWFERGMGDREGEFLKRAFAWGRRMAGSSEYVV